jgi:energy-coupling factor transporter ATP-binding protein EcfA2
MMTTTTPAPALTEALDELRDELARLELGLELPSAIAARRTRDELVRQVGDYLLPRLRQMDAPLLMVVGGSTGAGKSTLVNSLVGSVVSPAGVLRPTTRAPVLATNPDDVRWFRDERILPALPRRMGGAAAPGELQIVSTRSLPSGLALLDSPDIDSVLTENRELAAQLLAAADGWLFVTTAARYADAVPWEYLRAARDRGTALSVVLNRVPAGAEDEVSGHLRSMLDEQGLEGAQLLVVPETRLEDELLGRDALSPVRRWLDALAADAQARAALVRRTLEGALASLPARVGIVETGVEEQLAAAAELRREVEHAHDTARAEIDTALRSGSLLRGEVLARWHEVVGTGDLMRALESRVGWLRDRLRSAITGKRPPETELQEAVESSVESVLRAAADRAAERAAGSWRAHPAGRRLLADHTRLEVVSGEFAEAAEREIRAWQTFVFDLVREEGAGKRTTARFASLGVNGAGLVVMLAVFAHTGGLTGAEVVVAGGTSALSQKVLEAIFGDQAVRALAAKARADLLERVEKLLAQEAERFTALLEPTAPDPASLERLRAATAALATAA